jgi:CRP-like cAMP-binding protein/predicted MFS family arabinose efflux permease
MCRPDPEERVTAAALPVQPSPFAVLRKRAFVYLWSAQLVSTIGDALTSLAAGIIVYRVTGSVLNVGLMLMATAVPTLIFGLIAGVVVDRFDRKRIMIAADLIRLVIVASIPLVVNIHIAWLYVMVMLSASVTQFFSPANESVLPEIASEEELGAANAIMAIAQFGSTAVGFALAGLLASTQSINTVFLIDAGTFGFSALMISFVKIAPLVTEELTTVGDMIRNLSFGAKFILRTPILRSMNLVKVPVLIAFGLQNVLLLPFALTALNATEFEYGIQEGLTSVGFVAGSLLMARLSDRLREGQWLVLSYLGMGFFGLVYALQTNIWLAITLIAFSGALNAPSFVAGRLINQRNTPREMRGRVFSTSYVITTVVYLVGMGVAGLADVIDVRLMFAAGSVVVIVSALVTALLPGLGQPAAEWRRAIALLRGAGSAPGMAFGRPASLTDVEMLLGYIPALAGMPPRDRDLIINQARVRDAAAGTAITRAGETGESAFFVLGGRVVAGVTTGEGANQTLSTMTAGDLFGEIAALTGSVRTADVVAEEDSTLLEVPAETLRRLMAIPDFSRIVHGKMSERLARTASLADLPRFGGIDQKALRQLKAESAIPPETVPETT